MIRLRRNDPERQKTRKDGDLKIKQDSTMQARLGGEQESTHSEKTMTDRYRCGPDSNWTNMIGKWSIDIGAASTQTEL